MAKITGGGIQSNKNVSVGQRLGSPSKATSPEAASQLDQSTSFPKKPIETGLGNRSPVPLGNSLTNNVGPGGAGAGRTLYGQGGTQGQHGQPNPGVLEPKSTTFEHFFPGIKDKPMGSQLKALQDQLNPPSREPFQMPRFDPTEGMSMDRATMRRMAAVDDPLGRAADLRAYQQQQRSLTSSPAEPQRQRGSGWIEPRPLEPPSGISHCDAIMDHQDKIDRAETVERLAKAAAVERAAKAKEDK
jgi:hypothetical protein